MQIDERRIYRFEFPAIKDIRFHFDIPAADEATAKELLKECLAQMVVELEDSIYHRNETP
jgi:hypothetical protein